MSSIRSNANCVDFPFAEEAGSARGIAFRIAAAIGRILLTIGFVLIMLAVMVPQALGQISPGPLSKAHHALDGPAGCTKCHAVSAGSPNFKCLDCHREISLQLQQKHGLHVTYVTSNPGNSGCVKCHSEHNGAEFALVRWQPSLKAFDHRQTGFVLDGKHANLTCNQCHNAAKLTPSGRSMLGSRDPSRTFLGLGTSCVDCHEDKHRGELGPTCTQCHNTVDWKRSFDHGKTKFPLRGAHLQVTCAKCHTPGSDGKPRFTGISFETCASCHSDPHRGAFVQQRCESCHNLNNWKQTLVATRFDHSKTKFPLLGKHEGVSCQSCHRKADFKTAIAFAACADCHKPDPHKGQFAKRADGGRCDSCHTVDGFKQAKFTLVDHNKAGFPLLEKHATVACAKCHTPAGKATVFKVKFATCLDCHQDAHKKQFAAAPYFNRCERCHNESGFEPSTFTLAMHQQGKFVLTGGHMAIACNQCHKPAGQLTVAAFHFDGTGCTSCHADPHRNQFASRMAKLDAAGHPLGCEACHSTKTWQELDRFDHGTTKFLLVGTHKAVRCVECHRPPNLERKLANVDFSAAPKVCDECHEDPHEAQFAKGQPTTRCADCHNTMKWRPSLFDHEKTAFPLKGAHQNVRCKACHVSVREVSERAVLLYKPTPTACAACHSNGTSVAKGS